ncbi:DUF421 domain-containing protein [Aequorivita sp. SDUM287046]|uniref:DUF421 domain-containing protein n=1 Tax=Aequorivita aurantiaca TaxID=3053356 RepID=A0ABT8DFX1_9FLAO|nr:YetF domain-containing protein [Aequorivita aurantiaca]MDN3724128.1 DUF421 domain-containing protein [Aequorivita aurantiaca]
MENSLQEILMNSLHIFLSCLGIYIAVILFTRFFGKRSFSKMSSFDFAMTLAIGSIIASTTLPQKVTLYEGIIGLFSVYLLQSTAAYFRRFRKFQKVIDNEPILLMDRTEILHENLKKVQVTEGDLRAKLREANVIALSQVRAVIFETTGDMVVLRSNDEQELEQWIMKDVKLK